MALTTPFSEGDLLRIEILTIKKLPNSCLKRNFLKKQEDPGKTHSSKCNTAQRSTLKDNATKKARQI